MADSEAPPRRPARPKVVQPKPTNKDIVAPPPQPPSSAVAGPSSEGNRPSRPAIQNAPGSSTANGSASRPTVPRIVGGAGSGSSILVNNLQKGNKLLSHIRSVGWEYSSIVPDYQVGTSTCALFLSLKYHQLHPEYIYHRISKLAGMFNLRLLLILNDADNPVSEAAAIKELTKTSITNNLTIIIAWSMEDAAKYLEMFKMYEHKGSDLIRERGQTEFMPQMQSLLTNINKVTKPNAVSLMSNFGSLRKLSQASAAELSAIPGLGDIKATRIRDAFTAPFRTNETRTYRERKAARLALEGREGVVPRSSGRFLADDEDEIEDEDALATGRDAGTMPAGGIQRAMDVAKESEATGSDRPINANGKRVGLADEPDIVQQMEDPSIDQDGDDVGPNALDFGPDFDLDEEELALLEGNAASASPSKEPTSSREDQRNGTGANDSTKHVSSSSAAQRLQAKAVPEDEDEFDDALTQEEREEMRLAMQMSMGDD